MRVTISAMRISDLPAVLAVERASQARPWSLGMFTAELRRARSRRRVARAGGRVLGFAILHLAGDQMELLTVAVRSSCRRRGIGRRLVADALTLARRAGAAEAHLEVRRSNGPALALYRELGFEVVGERGGYYAGAEDALLLRAIFRQAGEVTGGDRLCRRQAGSWQ